MFATDEMSTPGSNHSSARDERLGRTSKSKDSEELEQICLKILIRKHMTRIGLSMRDTQCWKTGCVMLPLNI